MEEIEELRETLMELTDDMLSRIQSISEYENNTKLSLDKINVFNTLINDLSIFYECTLIISQYHGLSKSIRKLNNIMNYIYVNYDTNLYSTFEIITVDFKEVLFEMKGTLRQ